MSGPKAALLSIVMALLVPGPGAAPELLSFPSPDGGVVHAHLRGNGTHLVVFAHGGRFTKESWAPDCTVSVKAV